MQSAGSACARNVCSPVLSSAVAASNDTAARSALSLMAIPALDVGANVVTSTEPMNVATYAIVIFAMHAYQSEDADVVGS